MSRNCYYPTCNFVHDWQDKLFFEAGNTGFTTGLAVFPRFLAGKSCLGSSNYFGAAKPDVGSVFIPEGSKKGSCEFFLHDLLKTGDAIQDGVLFWYSDGFSPKCFLNCLLK
jgi:hypothetical protein